MTANKNIDVKSGLAEVILRIAQRIANESNRGGGIEVELLSLWETSTGRYGGKVKLTAPGYRDRVFNLRPGKDVPGKNRRVSLLAN